MKWIKSLFGMKKTTNHSEDPGPVESPKTYRKEFYIKTQYSSFSSRASSVSSREAAPIEQKREWRMYNTSNADSEYTKAKEGLSPLEVAAAAVIVSKMVSSSTDYDRQSESQSDCNFSNNNSSDGSDNSDDSSGCGSDGGE